MKKSKIEMSQSFIILAFIILSGGLQDAYSYFYRGEVFANAQTGNIVLLSANIVSGNYAETAKYLVSIGFFLLGAIVAKTFSFVFGKNKFLFWKQIVLIIETFALTGAAFMPQNMNLIANALVSFACAMQVLAFDRIYGNDFASTMCIGNMVRMSGSLVAAIAKKDKIALKRFVLYLTVVIIFAIGASAGYLLQKVFESYTILFSAALTLTSALMFFFGAKQKEDNKFNREQEVKNEIE